MVQVLVVDDDPDIRLVLSLLLEDADYTVSLAQDGHEALQVLRASRDGCVVLLDINMPFMDGWEVLRTVRQENPLSLRHTFVLMTAGQRTFPVTQARALTEWPVSTPLLAKPFELAEVLTVVDQAAQRLGETSPADENRTSEEAG